jgi:cellulose synthase/poly-beta-1,6-N-acetylglucosamine synthase-like glycosyltransferase
MAETIFFAALLGIAWAYFGYPASLWLLGRWRRRPVHKTSFLPQVTLIITACNEEQRIGEKMENTLALAYPADRLQILVASDGSSDGTNAIVAGYAAQGVELIALPERGGKENAQREAVTHARGEILVFSDVATRLEGHGLKEIVGNFADPTVGCVSSVDRLLRPDGSIGGEGLYVRYEMKLRRLESQVNSLVGLSGSFFAARREVCQDFATDMQSDFRTLLNSMRLGLRGVTDREAIGYYADVADSRREFDRKIRTVLRGLTVFFRNLEFLNPFRYGLFAYQYACHKLLRWLVPVFLLIALVAHLRLAWESGAYLLLLVPHAGFYLAALWGWSSSGPPLLARIPMYFLSVNAAILVAWWRYVRGERMVMWTPSQR